MEKIFSETSRLEQKIKDILQFPDYIMMENAASCIKQFILENFRENLSIYIFCGKGNNGADGYAVSRLLLHNSQINQITLISIENPSTMEAKKNSEIAEKLGIQKISLNDFIKNNLLLKNIKSNFKNIIFLDCVFGTGFHGEFSTEIESLFTLLNSINCTKIACDVPSGLHSDGTCCKNTFCADYTLTMGTLKLQCYSDSAKQICGKIIACNLGIPSDFFETASNQLPQAFLVSNKDIKLPFRKNKISHKGTFGHTTVFSGDKSGAAILAASAANSFGSGLTSLLRTKNSNLSQFKISPQLMITDKIPKKTTCIILGSGIETFSCKIFSEIREWFLSCKNNSPAFVFDAGLFSNDDFIPLLKEFSSNPNARIVLTPHLLEFSNFCKKIKLNFPDFTFSDSDFEISNLSSSINLKIELTKAINKLLPNITLIIKSANTIICENQNIYIITEGNQNLSKGGSGDILAGMIGSLLAQGYSSKDAAITGCQYQADISNKINPESYNLNFEKFISLI